MHSNFGAWLGVGLSRCLRCQEGLHLFLLQLRENVAGAVISAVPFTGAVVSYQPTAWSCFLSCLAGIAFLPVRSFGGEEGRQQGIKGVNRNRQRLAAVIGRILFNFGVALSSGCPCIFS